MLQNILSNAIKYNLPQGWIHIQGQRHRHGIYLVVANASPDLGTVERDRLF